MPSCSVTTALRKRNSGISSCSTLTTLLLAIHAQAATVTLNTTADATLYDSPTGSIANGAGQHAFIGRNSSGNTRRTLLSFDIAAALPPDAIITGITLTLNVSSSSGGPRDASLHRLLENWSEGPSDPAGSEGGGAASTAADATWLHRSYDTLFWSTPGGTFEPIPSASTITPELGLFSFSSTQMIADVQSWLDAPSANFGWIIRGDESTVGTAKRFDSRENPDANLHPALTISFIPAPPTLLVAATLVLCVPRRRSTQHL